MDDTSPFAPTEQKFSQNIPVTGAAVLWLVMYLESESELQYRGPVHPAVRLNRILGLAVNHDGKPPILKT